MILDIECHPNINLNISYVLFTVHTYLQMYFRNENALSDYNLQHCAIGTQGKPEMLSN